jgi:hypothetical protein
VRIRADAVDALPAFKESIERNRNGPGARSIRGRSADCIAAPGVTQAVFFVGGLGLDGSSPDYLRLAPAHPLVAVRGG